MAKQAFKFFDFLFEGLNILWAISAPLVVFVRAYCSTLVAYTVNICIGIILLKSLLMQALQGLDPSHLILRLRQAAHARLILGRFRGGVSLPSSILDTRPSQRCLDRSSAFVHMLSVV